MTDSPAQRVSDADREAVAERLREAAGEGRLDPEELDERLGAAYRARTRADLEPLTKDLPGPRPKQPSLIESRHLRERIAGFLVPNIICIAIWAATGAGSFWPGWVLLFTGIPLVILLVRGALGLETEGRPRQLPSGRDARGRRRRSL